MKTKALLRETVELMVLLIGLTDGMITCYSCNSTDGGGSPCIGSVNVTCSTGHFCRTTWFEYAPPNHRLRKHECGNNSTEDVDSLDNCLNSTASNETYFVYGDQCCRWTGTVANYGTIYAIAHCTCWYDYCNALTAWPIKTTTNIQATISTRFQPTTNALAYGNKKSSSNPICVITLIVAAVTSATSVFLPNLML